MADMSREEAARVLEMLSGDLLNIENADLINKILDAMSMGAAALRGWVKTADRLPTEADGYVIGLQKSYLTDDLVPFATWCTALTEYPSIYWMPLLPLPEVEG